MIIITQSYKIIMIFMMMKSTMIITGWLCETVWRCLCSWNNSLCLFLWWLLLSVSAFVVVGFWCDFSKNMKFLYGMSLKCVWESLWQLTCGFHEYLHIMEVYECMSARACWGLFVGVGAKQKYETQKKEYFSLVAGRFKMKIIFIF